MLSERQAELYDQFSRLRRSYSKAWQDASIEVSAVAFATVEELTEFKRRLRELVLEFTDRHAADRPAGVEPVALSVRGFPMRPPGSDGQPGSGGQPGGRDQTEGER